MGIAPRAEGNFNARQVPPFGSWLNASKPGELRSLCPCSVSGCQSLVVEVRGTDESLGAVLWFLPPLAPSPELATLFVDLSGPHSLPVKVMATAVAGRALESLATLSRLSQPACANLQVRDWMLLRDDHHLDEGLVRVRGIFVSRASESASHLQTATPLTSSDSSLQRVQVEETWRLSL